MAMRPNRGFDQRFGDSVVIETPDSYASGWQSTTCEITERNLSIKVCTSQLC